MTASMNAPPAAVSMAKLGQLCDLNDNWDSYGAKPPSDEALEVVRLLTVVPTRDGGVQIEWHCNGWDVEIEVGRDGTPIGYSTERWRR